jgi:multisubunit Na+/H+ antiporter MnhG subunit
VAQLQAVWNKLNPRERLSAIGAGVIILAWLIGLLTYGAGAATISFLGALAVLGIFYVKHTPSMSVNWPAAPSLIVLVIAAIVGLLELPDLFNGFRLLGFASYFGGGIILSILLAVVGAVLMVWGAWQEYQVEKPELPDWARGTGAGASGPSAATPPPMAPSAPAPPPAAAPPASPTPMDEHDEAPPA